MPRAALALAALLPVALAPAQTPPEIPGPLGKTPADGVRLATGWKVTPAGTHVVVGDMLQSAALSPDGATLAMVGGGAALHQVHLIDPDTGALRQSLTVGRAQSSGIAWSADSRALYVAGGNGGRVHAFTLGDDRRATESPAIPLPDTGTFQSGLALSQDGKTLFVANLGGDVLYALEVPTGKVLARRALETRDRPGALALAPDGQTLYAALWGRASVLELDPTTLATRRTLAVAAHPNDLRIRGERLFVSCGNADAVLVVDRTTGAVRERIHTALTPRAPLGATPSALALAPDGKTLFVANSDSNAVAVIDIATPDHSVVEGFIPTAHYPSAVAVSADGRRLFIGCGKGLGTGPNPIARTPDGKVGTRYPYIATLLRGVVSTLPVPDRARLAAYTKQVYANTPYAGDFLRERPAKAPRPGSNPVPSKVGDRSPIKYVLYIIKENRTYDQVFGDLPQGNGDPSLTIFGEDVTPNHHALAREFVLFDNLYANGEVSVDGHHWSNGAFVPDSMQRLWPAQYGAKGSPPIRYGDFGDPLAETPGPRLWDLAAAAKVPFRTYYYHTDKNRSDAWAKARSAGVRDHLAADIYLKDLAEWEASGQMPRLVVMALSEDHTKGATPGAPTPQAAVASNDLALGKIVAACSKSRFWKEMAIFVIEDDAQNGPDHVDAHRTVGLAISPYTRRGGMRDSTFHNTTSMLRTIELILGLPPMSPFDAAATPMYAAFTAKADPTPYVCRPPKIDLEAKNPARSALAEMGLHLDLSAPDRLSVADEQTLNRILWHSVRGLDTPYPGTVRRPWFWPTGHARGGDADD